MKETKKYIGTIIPTDVERVGDGWVVQLHRHYVSEEHFRKVFRENTHLPFGHALEAVKSGEVVTRKVWDTELKFIVKLTEQITPSIRYDSVGTFSRMLSEHLGRSNNPMIIRPSLGCVSKMGHKWVLEMWSPTQEDLFADDWMIVKDACKYVEGEDDYNA